MKILEILKKNKLAVIGVSALVVGELCFLIKGHEDGLEDGITKVFNDISDMPDDTYDKVKDFLINNKGWKDGTK